MNRRVLIVGAAEGFIIKGLEAKLKGIDVASVYSPPVMKDIKGVIKDTDLVIIFTDERMGIKADALVYIKDHCAEVDSQVIVIGTRSEYSTVMNYIPEGLMYKFFERPLEIETLITDIEKYMDEESQYARKKSILIVDDDVSYMSMIMDWLKDAFRVSLANSGMEAITWLAKNRADLILLDYEMPITSGPQVLEMLRSNAGTSDIPVMFLTGKGDKESIMKVLSLKPEGYILKSVERNVLRETLAKFFVSQMS